MKKVILLSTIMLAMFASCEPEKQCTELIIRENPAPNQACCYYIDVPCD
jgi:hypothetical protein